MKKVIFISLLLMGFASIISTQAEPPDLLNYQGVLRNSQDNPLDDDYDMKFYFFSADVAGDEILIDQHLAAGTGAVTVSDGLFNAELGGGSVLDGLGPGTYNSLSEVFRDYSTVYLEIQIYNSDTLLWETLSPRIQILSVGYALNADHLDGQNSNYFIDTSSNSQTKFGRLILDNATSLQYGLEAYGLEGGGYFKDLDHSGEAHIAKGQRGIQASGSEYAGYFEGDGYFVGNVDVTGNLYAEDIYPLDEIRFPDGSSQYTSAGDAHSLDAADGSPTDALYVDNIGNVGIGTAIPSYKLEVRDTGYFHDATSSGYAQVGFGDNGISGYGNSTGGYFSDTDSIGYAYVGYGNYGILARGSYTGGLFQDEDEFGYAFVGHQNRGIWGYGTGAGGYFEDTNSSGWANVGNGSNKINGNGSVSFVQNHPNDQDKVIVYSAPEGDEVATYTRGKARLIKGKAHVSLGETFKWVTNPDIGLTAYVTPYEQAVPLAITSLNTEELVVQSPAGYSQDIVFDYIVYGLRIGFEESSVIQGKEREAYIPSMQDYRDLYEQHPELREYNAFERYKQMRLDNGITESLDLSASVALKNSIEEYDPAIHGPVEPERPDDELLKPDHEAEVQPQGSDGKESMEGKQITSPENVRDKTTSLYGTLPIDDEGNIHAKSFRSISPDLTSKVPISEQAETGDILTIDPVNKGMMRLCDRAADPAVVGIVAGEPGVVLGGSNMSQIEKPQQEETEAIEGEESSKELVVEIQQAPIALSGIVLCKVDAAYGAIQAGDLLTTSLTKGHAMRSEDHAPGTIIGKSLEPLDAGTGLIKVLVMMR